MLKRQRGPAPLQTPVRSGLPSAVRGVGAAMLALPSGRRGVPAVGYLSHCASAVVDRSDAKTARAAALDRPIVLMGPLLRPTIIHSDEQRGHKIRGLRRAWRLSGKSPAAFIYPVFNPSQRSWMGGL